MSQLPGALAVRFARFRCFARCHCVRVEAFSLIAQAQTLIAQAYTLIAQAQTLRPLPIVLTNQG